VSRIGLKNAFRRLVEKAGLTPDAAVAVIDQQTKRSDGKLDLYCNGKLPPRSYIRQFLRFELGDNGIVVIGQIGAGWGRADNIFKFKLDADQVEALITNLTKPKPTRRKPPMSLFKQEVIEKAKRLIKAGAENIVAKLADLWDDKRGKAKDKERRKKERRYRKRTIHRWLKDARLILKEG
jgi:hypothetical protein